MDVLPSPTAFYTAQEAAAFAAAALTREKVGSGRLLGGGLLRCGALACPSPDLGVLGFLILLLTTVADGGRGGSMRGRRGVAVAGADAAAAAA